MAALAARSCSLQTSSLVRGSVVDSKLESPVAARLLAQPRRRTNLASRRDVTVAATPLVDTFTDFFKQLTAGASKKKDDASETVESLLALFEGTDRGATMDDDEREEVNALVESLEAQGMKQPLKSPLIFGEWEVVYTSNPTAAGGYYRSLIGRTLLQAKYLAQTLSQPANIGNRVDFSLLGIVPGSVTIDGTFEALDPKTVKVTFDPPNLTLGPASFTYGGQSSVQLSTTYLDSTIRIGRGSRGSIFVFARRD